MVSWSFSFWHSNSAFFWPCTHEGWPPLTWSPECWLGSGFRLGPANGTLEGEIDTHTHKYSEKLRLKYLFFLFLSCRSSHTSWVSTWQRFSLFHGSSSQAACGHMFFFPSPFSLEMIMVLKLSTFLFLSSFSLETVILKLSNTSWYFQTFLSRQAPCPPRQSVGIGLDSWWWLGKWVLVWAEEKVRQE